MRAGVNMDQGGAVFDLRPYAAKLKWEVGIGTKHVQDASYPFLIQEKYRAGYFTHYAGEGTIRSAKLKYQGEEFKIDASNDKCSIWIYDLAWMGIATSDTNADFLKQAINKVNQNSAVTNLYTEYKGYIVAHCKIVTYFTYNIPDYKGFFKAVLDAFFTTHQQVRDEFMDLTKNQEQKERVEIKGFHS